MSKPLDSLDAVGGRISEERRAEGNLKYWLLDGIKSAFAVFFLSASIIIELDFNQGEPDQTIADYGQAIRFKTLKCCGRRGIDRRAGLEPGKAGVSPYTSGGKAPPAASMRIKAGKSRTAMSLTASIPSSG